MVQFLKSKLFLFSTVILFSTISSASEPGFYFKAMTNFNKMDTVNGTLSKQKSIVSPGIGVGVGYHINDTTRTDLTFDYSVNSFREGAKPVSSRVSCMDVSKVYIHSVMLNIYRDMYTNDNFNLFIGAGVGLAQVHDQIKLSMLLFKDHIRTASVSRKISNNFAYSLMMGANTKINEKIDLELMYSFRDFGKTNSYQLNPTNIMPKRHFQGHIGTIGIRYNL